MTVFTIVHYRPNGSDYVRNCLMGSSDSDHEINVFTNIEHAAKSIAAKRMLNKNSEREVAAWESYVLIDGWSENSEWPGYDAVLVDPWSEVENAANSAYNAMLEEEQQQKDLAEKQRLAAVAEKNRKAAIELERRERDDLARLSAKYR